MGVPDKTWPAAKQEPSLRCLPKQHHPSRRQLGKKWLKENMSMERKKSSRLVPRHTLVALTDSERRNIKRIHIKTALPFAGLYFIGQQQCNSALCNGKYVSYHKTRSFLEPLRGRSHSILYRCTGIKNINNAIWRLLHRILHSACKQLTDVCWTGMLFTFTADIASEHSCIYV